MNLPPLQPRLPIPRRPPFPAIPALHQPPSRQLHRLQPPIQQTNLHLSKRPRATIKRRPFRRTLKVLNTHSHRYFLSIAFQVSLTIIQTAWSVKFRANQMKQAI